MGPASRLREHVCLFLWEGRFTSERCVLKCNGLLISGSEGRLRWTGEESVRRPARLFPEEGWRMSTSRVRPLRTQLSDS